VTTPAQSTPGVQLLGVNLSGAEYGNPVTGVMNYNYVYPTTAEINYFASLGLNTIRIPVA
jgi:endoglucanase